MAEVFNLPAVGDTMVEGEIVQWFVEVGDVVDLDQVICEIETDKSVVEMSTPFRGTVLQLGADAGGVVEVGAPLLVVGEPGEPIPSTPEPPTPDRSPAPAAPTAPPPAQVQLDRTGPSRESFAVSPLLRRYAHEEGVDLSSIVGTGPGGRITRADVEAAVGGAVSSARPVPSTDEAAVLAMPRVRRQAREHGIDLRTVAGSGPHGSVMLRDLPEVAPVRGRRERLSAMRRTIARNLTRSAQEIPQFTSMVEVDASRLLSRRAELKATLDGPVPLDALLMEDLVATLRLHPLMNAQLVGDDIEFFDDFDLGVAVDTADGLMVPVVRSADTRDIVALAAEIVRLAVAARDRTIAPVDLSGGTCTVNNVGALGVVAGTPILPFGTSTIVAFGATRPLVALRDGKAVEVPTMTLSATFDHRMIDGGGSGRFLRDLKSRLELGELPSE